MRRFSLGTKFCLLIFPLVGVSFLLLTALLSPFRALQGQLRQVQSAVSEVIVAEQFARLFDCQLKEYVDHVFQGDEDERLEEVQRQAQATLARWKAQIAIAKPEEKATTGDQKRLDPLEQIEKLYTQINALGHQMLGLLAQGEKEQARALALRELEPLTDSLAIQIDRRMGDEEAHIEQVLTYLHGRIDGLGVFTFVRLQREARRARTYASRVIFAERFTRSFARELREYSKFAFTNRNKDELELLETQEKRQEAKAGWLVELRVEPDEHRDELAAMEQFDAEYALVNQLGRQVFNLVKGGKHQPAIDIVRGEMTFLADSLFTYVDQMVIGEEAEMELHFTYIANSVHQLETGVCLVLFGVLAVGFGSPWLVSRRIIVPILRLKHTVLRIGAGELELRTEVASADELGELGATIDAMAKDLQTASEALRRAQTELEIRVQERTAELARTNAALQQEILHCQQMEDTLQASEATYRSLIEQATDGIYIIDAQGNFLLVNSQTCVMSGYTQDELLQMNIRDFLLEEDLTHAPLRLEEIRTSKQIIQMERRARRRDGSLLYIESRARALDEERIQVIVHDVTARKQTEAALRKNEERQALILGSLPMGFYTAQTVSNVSPTWMGGQIHEISGFSSQQFLQDPRFWASRLHPDDRKRVLQELKRALQTGHFVSEYRWQHADGSYRWFFDQAVIIQEGAGAPPELIGVWLNITERKHAEEELRRAKCAAEAANEALQVEVVERRRVEETVVEQARIVACNSAIIAALTQRNTLEEILSGCTEALVHHLDAALARIWLLDQEGKVLELQASAGLYTHLDGPHSRIPIGESKIGRIAQHRKPDLSNAVLGDFLAPEQAWAQREVLVAFAGYPLLAKEQLVGVLVLSTHTQLTDAALHAVAAVADEIALSIERKRTEAVLQQSEEYFRSLIEHAADMIAVLKSDGIFCYQSPSMERVLGYAPEELSGQSLFTFVHPDDVLTVVNTFSETLQNPRAPLAVEFRCQCKDESWRTLEGISKSLLDAPAVAGIVMNIWDITERKRAEERQTQLLKELESSKRELNDFAYVVSHDLKAPLRAISSLASWLAADYAEKLDDAGKEQLNLLLGRTKRMHNLIEGILHYSRLGRIKEKMALVNLNTLVVDVTELLAPPAHIAVTVENTLPTLVCEPTRIGQVFQNLLSNAIKFMDKPQGRVTIGCVEADGRWRFHIADNGPGIEEKYFAKIFQIFQTLAPRDEFENTGIGLTVVKKIVELHGGKIGLESTVGRGTTFFFTLPKHQKSSVEFVNDSMRTDYA